MNKEMKDLKNIKYKPMLLSNSNYNNLSPRDTNDVNNINDFLEKEKQTHTNELWSKLDKTIKMQKIRVFVDDYSTINNLTLKESKFLLSFLTTSLDQKRLAKSKDVIYDRENGVIKSIPSLLFNQINRKFTLKRCEKRQSTLKSLPPKKVNKTRDNKAAKNAGVVENLSPTNIIISSTNSRSNSNNNSNNNSDDENK
jgi:hypothetical protein